MPPNCNQMVSVLFAWLISLGIMSSRLVHADTFLRIPFIVRVTITPSIGNTCLCLCSPAGTCKLDGACKLAPLRGGCGHSAEHGMGCTVWTRWAPHSALLGSFHSLNRTFGGAEFLISVKSKSLILLYELCFWYCI